VPGTPVASPYGLVGLLTVAQTREVRPTLTPPESDETLSLLVAHGFFRHAEELFEAARHGAARRPTAESERAAGDNVGLQERRRARCGGPDPAARPEMERERSIDAQASVRFVMTLSEVCRTS